MTNLTAPPLGDDARLPSDIVGLDRLQSPVWVFDPVTDQRLYANPSALALWGAAGLAVPSGGESRTEMLTFHPDGKPVSVRAIASPLALRDGSSAILFEASRLEALDADDRRGLEAVRHANSPVSLYDETGEALFNNPCATRTYGGRQRFEDRCEDPDAARAAWTSAQAGQFDGRLSMLTERGVVCHSLSLRRTLDPVTGATAFLSYDGDETEKIATEAHLAWQMKALEAAIGKAEAANEAKSIFLANMSHEIRTPLNGVVGLADLLCRSDLTAAQREAAELILASGRSLEGLLADILQLAQIEAGEVTVVVAPFSLATVARDVTDLMRLKAEDNGSTLDLRIDLPSGESRYGDALRVRQILTNLTSNAVKFTSDGSVVVQLSERTDGVRILVQDTGIGFDPEQKSRIFERFQQADASIIRHFGGAGLGLAITSSLVQRMGGQLDCESTPGVGSSFWVDLPLPVGEPAAPTEAGRHGEGDLQGLKVLVADDHPVNRRVISLVLEPLGVEVVAVENGAEAVGAVEEAPFDVVLMDMQMPVMDGLEATRTIVAADGPPVVMVSANGLPKDVAAALDAGAVGFVVKPVLPETLIESVIAAVDHDPAADDAAEDPDAP